MGNASVQRGLFLTFRLFSLIRHALRRATFPVGEGDLPAGAAFIGARLSLSGVPSTPGPGYARSTLSKQERATSRRGDIHRGLFLASGVPSLFLALAFFGIVWYNVQK